MSVTEVAINVYGDATRTALLFAANAIPDPLLIPGRVLKILPT